MPVTPGSISYASTTLNAPVSYQPPPVPALRRKGESFAAASPQERAAANAATLNIDSPPGGGVESEKLDAPSEEGAKTLTSGLSDHDKQIIDRQTDAPKLNVGFFALFVDMLVFMPVVIVFAVVLVFVVVYVLVVVLVFNGVFVFVGVFVYVVVYVVQVDMCVDLDASVCSVCSVAVYVCVVMFVCVDVFVFADVFVFC